MKKLYALLKTKKSIWFMWILVAALPFTTVAQLTRTQIINNAAAYTTFSWTASSCNLWSGTSCGGANVYKAPWVTSVGTKISMPYSWGGWSTTTEFNTAMSGCKSAGQVCSSVGGGCTGFPSAPLTCAGGHDCSGLVSRAWALSSKYSTSTLPNISSSIALTSTQPGDILNDAGSHVRLVETNYGNGNYQVIEASGADWKTAYHSYTTANLSGYDPRCPNPSIVDGGCSILAPANDNCPGAVTFPALQPGICVGVNSGQDVSGATQSLPPALCTGCNCTSTAAMDVWFKFTAINTSQTIQLTTSNGFDGVIEIRKGPSCNGSYLECYDPSGTPSQILYTYNNFTVGQVYYIRVFDYGTTPPAVTTFDICIASPASSVCNITSINPSTETHNPESFSTTPGADDIIVNGQPFCTYTVTESCSWLTATPSSGTMSNVGQAFINYSIQANPNTASRSCSVSVNGSSFTIIQNGCTNDFSPSTKSVSASGTTYNLDIGSYSPCSWDISNNCPWVHLSQSSGQGDQTISVTVDPNTTCSPQTCTLTISPGNDTHTINQAGNQVPNQPSTINGLTNLCQGVNGVAYSVTNVSGINYSWEYSGSGALISSGSGTSSITVNYSASATSGMWTVTPNNSCGNGTPRTLSVTVGQMPSPAGTITGSSTVCQGSNAISYTVPTIANAETYIWAYSGTGHTINGSSTNITINFTANATAGNLTVKGSNTCGQGTVSQSFAIAVNSTPTTNAGTDATICQTGTHQLSGTAQNQNSVLWTTSGNGTFSSSSSLNPVYTPGANDISLGTITLTLTANAISPCIVNATDNKILIIQKNPVANAGTDVTICQGSTHQLSGMAQNQNSVGWATSGTGSFSSTGSLNPVYTPSSADITNGTITFTLTATAISPCSVSASDIKILVIQKSPIADAGTDATICQNAATYQLSGIAAYQSSVLWTTSGNGTFNNATALNAVYTPSYQDRMAGTVTLTLTAAALSPCTVSTFDAKILIIQKSPIADAGADATICQGSTHLLIGTAQFQNSVLWATSGTGTFSNTASLSPVYTPGTSDINSGTVNLTLTVSAISPCTVSASDTKILVIQKTPTANAGTDATISATGTHTLSGAATNFSSILWSTSGNGTFSSTSSLTPVYTPGANDITNGSVTLTLNASAVSPCTLSAADSKMLVIQVSVIADAGFDQTICEDETAQLNGSASNYSSLSWTGNVSNQNILNPVYTPTPADISAGFAQVCLTANPVPPNTVASTDCMLITIISLPDVNAGEDATIGDTDLFTTNPIVTNATQTFWTTTGDGYFDDEVSAITIYNPGVGDKATGSVELCLVAVGDLPCQSQVEDCMMLTIGQTISDIISLNPGWNLISFDVTPSPATPASVFEPLIANNNLVMVTGYEQGGLLYDPNGLPFLNTLSEIKNGFGYWVKVTNAATLSVTGEPILPTFALNLKAGWNLVAYWPAKTITPEVAFASLISLGVLQTVTGYEQGGKFFDPNGPAFLNTLTEIKNGFGYWVKVSADFNGFTYPVAGWQCGDNFTDSRDGKVYTTVQIGTQCWMKQNINIGTRIDGISQQTNNGTIEKYCYDNLETNCDVYGGLYQWDEMMQYATTPDVQGICPEGWHLPADAEWADLTTFISSQPAFLCNNNTIYIAKALAATTNWFTHTIICTIGNNLAGNNATSYSALPGGIRTTDGAFGGVSNYGRWHSSSQDGVTREWGRSLYYHNTEVMRSSLEKSAGNSVRCLKD